MIEKSQSIDPALPSIWNGQESETFPGIPVVSRIVTVDVLMRTPIVTPVAPHGVSRRPNWVDHGGPLPSVSPAALPILRPPIELARAADTTTGPRAVWHPVRAELGGLTAKSLRVMPWSLSATENAIAAVGVEDGSIDCQVRTLFLGFIPMKSRAHAAIGRVQPPWSAANAARSARTARWVAASLSGSTRVTTASSSRRHSRPKAPCPTAGRKSGGPSRWVMWCSSPSRCKPCPGQNHRVELPFQGLVQSGLDIAPERHDFQIRTQEQQLCTPARRAGADPGSSRQSLECLISRCNQGIGQILRGLAPPPAAAHPNAVWADPSGCVRRCRPTRPAPPVESPW